MLTRHHSSPASSSDPSSGSHRWREPAPPPCVARQPILDSDGRVFAYELLFRRSLGVQSCDVSAHDACAHVIVDSVLEIGLDTLAAGKRAFVNITRDFLLSGAATLLPPDQVVIELLEDIDGDTDVVAACKAMKLSGYLFALDDFAYSDRVANLVPLVDYVKVDFQALPTAAMRGRAVAGLPAGRPRLIAEKIETPEQYEEAVAEKFMYFQGYFFGRPVLREARQVPASRVAYAALLMKLADPQISVSELERVIKHDASLSYRVLRALNSAATPLRVEIKSIRQAIILLGCGTIRRWASLWAFASMNASAHPELVVSSIIRARCCEVLETTSRANGGHGFLLGLCSRLDAILEQPMAAVVSHLPLDATVSAALLGRPNEARALLDCVIAYERGEWDRYETLAVEAGVDAAALPPAYQEGLRWSREFADRPR